MNINTELWSSRALSNPIKDIEEALAKMKLMGMKPNTLYIGLDALKYLSDELPRERTFQYITDWLKAELPIESVIVGFGENAFIDKVILNDND